MSADKKHSVLLPALLAAYCSALAWGWLPQNPSFEELYGDTFRAADFLDGWLSVGGWPWWTPNYLQGHSFALFAIAFLPIFLLLATAAVLSPWLSALSAFKLVGLATIFFGGWSAGALGKKLTDCRWTGLLIGILYATSAQFVLRVAMLEHLTTAACMVFAPLILMGFLRCEKNGAWRNALLLAVAVSAMALSYLKIFFLFWPCAALFLLWRFLAAKSDSRRHLVRGVFRAVLLTIPLGALPLIPSLRESQWLAFFDLEPFSAWQQNYSFSTALSWVDYGNWLTAGSALGSLSTLRHPQVDFYLGLPILLGILTPLLVLKWTPEWRDRAVWRTFRFFVGMLLVAVWFSSGPRSILASHFFFLHGAFGIPDVSVALSWLMLALQGVIIVQLWRGSRWQIALSAVSLLVYFAVPGFKLLEILPVFQSIRAPSAVWTAFGILSATLAAGAGWRLAYEASAAFRWRRAGFLTALIAFFLADVFFLNQAFFRPGLPSETFSQFQDAQKFLAQEKLPGSVYPLTGRYFFLATPQISGRAIASEALNRHFQLKPIRHMEKGGLETDDSLRAYFNLYGIAYILVDRQDPDVPKEVQEAFKTRFPTAFENDYFTVLSNQGSLAPAYYSQKILSAEGDSFLHAQKILSLGKDGFIAVEAPQGVTAGTINEKGESSLPPSASEPAFSGYQRLSLTTPRQTNYHAFTVTGLPSDALPGVVVVSEAYHPDWQASQQGKTLPVLRAVGALLSVQVQGAGDIVFRFQPPWWYSFCLSLSLVSWAGALALLAFPSHRWLTGRARRFWLGETIAPLTQASPDVVRPPLLRPLVIIPTWNEVRCIRETITQTLQATERCHLLIVDDDSPDGTAEVVRQHPAFGQRLHLLERKGKRGLAGAYKAGFAWAEQHGHDVVLEMDADLSHDPADIPRLLAALDAGADAAIGSRYLGGVRVMNWPEGRLLLSTGASRFVRLVTALPLSDATSGFKALRCTALQNLDWKLFQAEGYGFQIELHHALWQAGAKIVEVPIVFTERRDGETKMTLGIALEAAWHTIRLALQKQ